MEQQHISLVVRAAEQHFPPTLSLNNNTLHRQIVAIDSPQHPADTSNGCLSHHTDPDPTERLLWLLLELLDDNLGSTYARVSRALYHNKRPWRVNKWSEMLTPGLVYVVYLRHARSTRAGRSSSSRQQPMLFMSFMLTQEDGLLRDDPARLWSVLYLYEIQLALQARGRGLGSVMVSDYLVGTGRSLREATGMDTEQFFGIELTVFQENVAAIRFYSRLGMCRAADSPEERPEKPSEEPTGGRRLDVDHAQKPLYYLYVLRI